MAGIAAAAAGTACAAGLLRSEYERDQLSVEQVRLTSKKLKRAYTMVFLADLHDKEFGGNNERLLAAVRAVRPDVILIGGDTMVVKPGKADLTVTERLLKELVEIAPVYYGNGNHEQRMWREREIYGDLYRDFRRILHRYGVVYLSDSSAKIGEDIRISGLNLEKKFYLDFKPAPMTEHYVKSHLGSADEKRFQILLAHSPLFFDTYAGWGADLTLAGHFHGGTIRLPYLGGVMTPQYQFFLPCCAGTFAKGGRRMIVSRGLGTHSINIRFGNKPQLVVLQLQPENRPESEQ
jgi:hypothetical protein